MLRILFVASELYPLVKTGGLADVAGALTPALRRLGVDVRLLTPGYPAVLGALADAPSPAEIAFLPGGHRGTLRLGEAPNGVPLYALEAAPLFGRPGNPYLGPDGRDWPDNPLRFAALARAAAALARGADPGWRPDIVHGQDWQCGLVPAYLALEGGARPKTITTIHNIAYQGIFPASLTAELQLPAAAFSINGFEYWGSIGFLKAGLYYADRITTVSPTYAQEIREAPGGAGLEGLLAARRDSLAGILNGVDYAVWEPRTDGMLPERYDAERLHLKAIDKAALEREFGLESGADAPLFVVVSRLTGQKGLDLVLAVVDRLVAAGARLAVLGAGDPALEDGFRAAARRYPGRVAARIGYDEGLAHRMQGGGDAILVPSRSEPCGLTQLYGLRYGTLPAVRRTGGLADTVIDADVDAEGGTGFVFDAATPDALAGAIARASAAFRDGRRWRALQRRAMAQDFSWERSARDYAELYRSVAARRSEGS
jgi:starch synthase